jgi:hypothetical protein
MIHRFSSKQMLFMIFALTMALGIGLSVSSKPVVTGSTEAVAHSVKLM